MERHGVATPVRKTLGDIEKETGVKGGDSRPQGRPVLPDRTSVFPGASPDPETNRRVQR